MHWLLKKITPGKPFRIFQVIFSIFFSWNKFGMEIKRKHFPGKDNIYPNEDTDLTIESPGGSALHAFCHYLQKSNQNLKIATNVHASASVRHSLRLGIPCIVIRRNRKDTVHSLANRFPRFNSRTGAWLRYTIFFLTCPRKGVLFLSFEEVTTHPKNCVKKINRFFEISLRLGNNQLEKIRTSDG